MCIVRKKKKVFGITLPQSRNWLGWLQVYHKKAGDNRGGDRKTIVKERKVKESEEAKIFQSQNCFCHFSTTWLHKGLDVQDHLSATSYCM